MLLLRGTAAVANLGEGAVPDDVRTALTSPGSSRAYPTLLVVFFFLRPSVEAADAAAGTAEADGANSIVLWSDGAELTSGTAAVGGCCVGMLGPDRAGPLEAVAV